MFRVAAAEARYHLWTIVFWLAFAAAIVVGTLSIELRDIIRIPGLGSRVAWGTAAQGLLTGTAFAFLLLPVATASSAFRMLATEASEGRWRLLGSLPLSRAQLAAARLLRAVAVPLGTVALALPLLLLATLLDAHRVVEALRHEPWILPSLLLLGIGVALLITLLSDLTNLPVAQAIIIVVAVPIVLAVIDPSFRGWLQPALRIMPTAAGPLWLLGACLLLAAADIAVVARRPSARRPPTG